jgi:iron complex transport system substrate-binding protein
MIELAGGRDIFGKLRTPSFSLPLEDVITARPEVLVIAPCGYNADQARGEYQSVTFPREWQEVPAVRNNQIYYVDANAYFSRPGPRLITGLEILAKLFHPGVTVSREAEQSIHPLPIAAHQA